MTMTTEYDQEFSPKTLRPSRGAPVRFIGRIIAETQWDTKDGCWMRFTVWETKGRAYITEISGDAPGKPDQVHCTVGIVEPIPKLLRDGTHQLDPTAMQMAVLDTFDWHDRAKAMLKRELGWSPYIEVA
jgi:hypothetical protein